MAKLSAAGYSTYRIRQNKLLPESTIQKLRTGGTVTTDTINTICALLNCQPGDLLEYIPDAENAPEE